MLVLWALFWVPIEKNKSHFQLSGRRFFFGIPVLPILQRESNFKMTNIDSMFNFEISASDYQAKTYSVHGSFHPSWIDLCATFSLCFSWGPIIMRTIYGFFSQFTVSPVFKPRVSWQQSSFRPRWLAWKLLCSSSPWASSWPRLKPNSVST